MSDELKQLGFEIRHHRNQLGYSQESFAKVAGIHRSYMGGIERGERNICVLNLLKIAKALRIPVWKLFKTR